MKKIFTKKKIIILGIVALLAIVATGAFTFFNKGRKKASENTFTYTRTVTLAYDSLQETVVASGTIESQTTSTITANTNGATISKINYKVGDYVKEGDTIIELDTTNIYKQISKQQEKINDQEDQLEDNFYIAGDNKDDAKDNLNQKSTARTNAYNALSAATSAIQTYQENYDKASENLTNIEKACLSKAGKGASMITPSDYEIQDGDSEEEKQLKNEIKELKEEYEEALAEVNTAKAILDDAKNTYNYAQLESAYQEADKAFQSAYTSYQDVKSKYNQAESALEDGVDSDSLDDLYDSLADYKLKAKSSGQITNITAVLGGNASGTLATIQDTGKLKISLTIDEYDILKLKLGMKATIETDASDTVYEGVVSQISPTASSGGFEIEVKVTSDDISNLLIGMNAEVTIIVSEGEENFNVPIDAVEEKEDGTKVIYVQNSDGEFEEVEVTTGESNGYYIEIFSNELKAGDKVRASANEDEANVTTDSASSAGSGMGANSFPGGGDMGGFSGGNMPSGGGGMPSGAPGGF